MIRSLLYATDLGLCSSYVFQHALNLARIHQARLYVVHVVEPLGLLASTLLQQHPNAESLDRLRNGGLELVLETIEQQVFESLREDLLETPATAGLIRAVRVVQGDPPAAILKQAQDFAADLLVIGSRSQGDAQVAPLGRTASGLLQTARIPVYLVPLRQG